MTTQTLASEQLATLGGPKSVTQDDPSLFHWPIVTAEDEAAVLDVMRTASFSNTSITRQFEAEWSVFQGVKYSLGHCNGTAALLAAMFACGVGRGDEVIVPSMTYWASALPAFDLGATPVFCDIDPVSLCMDPRDLGHRITKRAKAIVPVHYCGHPADMDPIIAIARRHGVKVIEDVSHAHGAIYKGRMCGAIGDVGAMSMMGGKSFAIGEAGMLCTNDATIYERAVAFGHYERTGENKEPSLAKYAGLPLGGYKMRMVQTASAMGRVQLKYYPQRIKAIQDAMNRFWDLLEGVPGLRPHRPAPGSSSTMGGWYNPIGHYVPEELGGLPVEKFIEAVNAEGGRTGRGCNNPLHRYAVLNEADVYNDGKPTRIAFSQRDVRQSEGSLPVTEALTGRCFGVPWFKHDRKEAIERYAAAFKKVAGQAEKLMSA